MSKFVLINTTLVGTAKWFAGSSIDDTIHPYTAIAAAGGVLYAAGNPIVDAAALVAQAQRKNRAVNEAALDTLMLNAIASAAKLLQDSEHTIPGANLTDADATILVTDTNGKWRILPAATLSTNRALTLGTTGAKATDAIVITRLDATANTFAIKNGNGAATIFTMPASKTCSALAVYDGTDWKIKSFGVGS